MQHAKSCAGYCGEWTDQRSIVWNFCRMTDRHLANTIKHLESNKGRASAEDIQLCPRCLKHPARAYTEYLRRLYGRKDGHGNQKTT